MSSDAGKFVVAFIANPYLALGGLVVGGIVRAATPDAPSPSSLGDLKVTGVTYGSPVHNVYAGGARVPGVIIWASEKRTIEHREEVEGGKGGGGSVETVSYTYDVDVLFKLSGRQSVAMNRVWKNGELTSTVILGQGENSGKIAGFCEDIIFYGGQSDQLPDPIYEAYVGIGNAPAYRHSTTVMIKRLLLDGSGNLPSLNFEVLIVGFGDSSFYTPSRLRDVVRALCNDAGLIESVDYDVNGIDNNTRCFSYTVTKNSPIRKALEDLLLGYHVDVFETDKLYFVERPREMVQEIPTADLGASDNGDETPLEVIPANDLEVPSKLSLTFIDVGKDFAEGNQKAGRLNSAAQVDPDEGVLFNAGAADMSMDLAIGYFPDEANALANSLLTDFVSSSIESNFATTSKYTKLTPTDVVIATDNTGVSHRLRIVRKEESIGRIKFALKRDDPYFRDVEGFTTDSVGAEGASLADSQLRLLDVPIFQDADDNVGFYATVKPGISGNKWSAATIAESVDDVTYFTSALFNERGVFGEILAFQLVDWSDQPGIFDEQSRILVSIGQFTPQPTLSSVTRDVLINDPSVNIMVIGSEVVRFRDVELNNPGEYWLTGFMRGQRGTEWAMGLHGPNEFITLIRRFGMQRIKTRQVDLGIEKYYRAVTVNQDVEDASATTTVFANNAVALKPFAPVDLRAARNGSLDITFTWIRQTRYATRFGGTFGDYDPLGEVSELYELEVYSDNTFTTVVRTLSGLTTSQASYSSTDQTTDFGSPQSQVSIRVYQMSEVIGRGYAGERTV